MSSIFLSHNRRDKPFVRKLSERLQAHGIRTWVDEAEMRLGDSLVSKIETAIREFKYLGVVLSPNSVSSEWVRREVNVALTEEFHGSQVKVLPLLYQECEIPGFLVVRHSVDCTEIAHFYLTSRRVAEIVELVESHPPEGLDVFFGDGINDFDIDPALSGTAPPQDARRCDCCADIHFSIHEVADDFGDHGRDHFASRGTEGHEELVVSENYGRGHQSHQGRVGTKISRAPWIVGIEYRE